MIKKIILIYPPFPMAERYGKGLEQIGTCLPPLGLLSLGAVLENSGYEVKVYDSDLRNSNMEQLVGYVKDYNPDFVGIYCNTSNYHRVASYAENIKKIKNYPICLGGPHPVEMEKYRPSPHHYKELPMATMIVSRGCPFGCLYCASRNIWGRNYRTRSVPKVIEEIKFLIDKYKIKNINFWDDLWGAKPGWTEEFCRRMIDEKIKISWSCERRVDTVNLETLKMMKKAGCYSIFYGIESFDQECLDAVNKGIKVEQAQKAMELTKKAGIEVRANFILGLPNETPEKVKAMVKKICKINPDYIKFNILTPYPGTALYQEVKKGRWGIFKEDPDKSTGYFATFLPYGYKSFEELEGMRRYAFRKFHFRPRYIFSKIAKIRSFSDIKKYISGFKAVNKI